MWICNCNAFNDKAMEGFLEQNHGQRVRVSTVYNACTGGKKPQCGNCLPTIAARVKAHNGEAPHPPCCQPPAPAAR